MKKILNWIYYYFYKYIIPMKHEDLLLLKPDKVCDAPSSFWVLTWAIFIVLMTPISILFWCGYHIIRVLRGKKE